MDAQVTLTIAEAMQALAEADRQSDAQAITMEELRRHTGWGEKVAYRNVRAMVANGQAKAVRIYRPNIAGQMNQITAYQLLP